MLENIGKHRLTIPEALFLSFYIGRTICHMLYLGVAILLIQPQARLPVHRVAVESRQGFTAHGDGLHLGQFSPCPVDRWTDLGWKKKEKELDDGWPGSVEEQGLLLLVWRHHITKQYIKDVL